MKYILLALLLLPMAFAASNYCVVLSGGNVCMNTTQIWSAEGNLTFAGASAADGNNYTTSTSFSRTGDTVTLSTARSGASTLTASVTTPLPGSFACGGTDQLTNVTVNGSGVFGVCSAQGSGASYTNGTGINLTGTTFSIYQPYFDALFYSITNPSSYTTIAAITAANGNWSADAPNYSTTAQANALYYPLSTNPSNYYNATTLPADDDTPDSDSEVPNAITVSGGVLNGNTVTGTWTGNITLTGYTNNTGSTGCNYFGASKMCWNTTATALCAPGATGGLCS